MNFQIFFLISLFILKFKVSSKEINEKVLEELGLNIFSTYLDLSGQEYDSISEETFKGYPFFEIMHLENNRLTRIDRRVFAYSGGLRELWLESNKITSINKDAFSNNRNLEKLCMNNNPISNQYPDELHDICKNSPECILSVNKYCQKESKYFKTL